MRRLFIVLAKLVGLLQLYWALVNFMQIGATTGMLLAQTHRISSEQAIWGLSGFAVYMILSFGMAWLLLARTNWLADMLKIGPHTEPVDLKEDVLLRTGVKLIGLYVTVYAIPNFAKALLDYRAYMAISFNRGFWTSVLPSALQLALGLVLIFMSAKVVELLTKQKDVTEQTDSPVAE
jgi:hypothetical protein